MALCRAALVCLLGMASSLAVAASGADDPSTLLVRRVMELADSGRLFDTDFVARTLDVHPRFRAIDSGTLPLDCARSEPHRRGLYAEWTPPWAKQPGTVPSVAGIELPPDVAQAARSEKEYDRLLVRYGSFSELRCPSGVLFARSEEASVTFDNLPAFACVSLGRDDLRSYVVEPQRPSHHAAEFPQAAYRREDAHHGVSIVIEYRQGMNCPQRIRVTQRTDDSTPRRRARAAWQRCAVTAERAFCERFPAVRSNVAVHRYAQASCGTAQGLLDNPRVTAAAVESAAVVDFSNGCGF